MAYFRGHTIISFRKKSGFPNILSLDPKLSVGSQIKGKSGSQPSAPPSEQPAGEGEEWGGGVATFQVTPPSIHFLINTEVTTLKTTKQGPEVNKKSRNHPLPEATCTGVRTTVLGNMFFPSFLAKTKREKLLPGHIHGKFWPHSLQFAL